MHATRLLSRWGLVLALLFATFGQIAAIGSAGATAAAAAATTQTEDPYPGPSSTPKVKDTACPFADTDIPADIAARGNLACGTVEVPEDHAKPDGKSISVFVVQIPSISKKPNSSPLFVLAGGPGQGASGQLGQFSKTVQDPIASWYPFLKDHNVVLIDQRGTGYSNPNLVCPADLPATPGATPVSDSSDPNLTQADVYGTCAKALTRQGIDLGDYTTRQSAADLDFVRQALGAKQVDLLGTSYGTWLALEMMRDYGSKVRSAVLNSPVPPQSDLLGGQIIAFQDSLNEVYKGCAADVQCNLAYPHLETTLTSLVKKLDAKPLSVTYKDPTTGKNATGDVDGTTLMSLIYQLVFIGPFVPYVAPLIGTVNAGDDSFLSQLVPLLVSSNEGISNGLYYAVMCQDEVPFTSVTAIKNEAKAAKVSQDVIDEGLGSSEGTIDVCKDWGLKASPEIENTAVTSSIPTLIVTGKFDPITPTAYGKLLEKTLSNSTLITSPVAGHDPASTTGTCGVGIIHRFLDHPADTLDTSCLKDLSLDFSPQ